MLGVKTNTEAADCLMGVFGYTRIESMIPTEEGYYWAQINKNPNSDPVWVIGDTYWFDTPNESPEKILMYRYVKGHFSGSIPAQNVPEWGEKIERKETEQ